MRTLKKMEELRKKALNNHPPAKTNPAVPASDDLVRFKDFYEAAILGGQDTSRHVEADGFHPSMLGIYSGKCMRRAVYLLRGVEKVPNFNHRILRVFANGHSTHERIQGILQASGLEFEAEVPINAEDPPIRGHADGIITLPWNGRKILLEIKSCNENTFNARLKWKKAKDEHFDQANIYAHILGIDTIWILYENKDNQEYEIFEHAYSAKKALAIIKKWRKAYDIYERGEIPVRPYKSDSQACMSCDVRSICLSDNEIGVSINATNSEKPAELQDSEGSVQEAPPEM
jgi:hypothetical protein